MTRSNPFDFSDFGPPRRPPGPAPAGPHTRAPSGRGPAPRAPAEPAGLSGGFDPFAGQPPTPASRPGTGEDAFGLPATSLGAPGTALVTAGPPVMLFALALGLAVAGAAIAVLGVVSGAAMLPTAVAGWLLAGPVAIGAMAAYTRVDTKRRSEAVYSAPSWTGTAYWAVLAVCLIGIAVGAWQIALWAGRQ